MDALLTGRIDIDDQQWKPAKNEAIKAVAGPAGHLYAAHFLFWDTVAVAELATWERSRYAQRNSRSPRSPP